MTDNKIQISAVAGRDNPSIEDAEPARRPSKSVAAGVETVYIAFDRKTGRVLGTYSTVRISEHIPGERTDDAQVFPEINEAEIMANFTEDDEVISRVTDRSKDNIAITVVKEVPTKELTDIVIDPSTQNVMPRPQLVLEADRTELDADNNEPATIRIAAVDVTGRPKTDFEGPVKVTTTHGRLSERRGVVRLEGGVGQIQLSPVPETIDRVQVTATSPDGLARAGGVTVSFV